MIIVTGGAGFIGSNLVRALCARSDQPVVVVDDLSDGSKFSNLVDQEIADYIDKDDFLDLVQRRGGLPIGTRAVFHQGACSDTTQWDGRFMMRNNFEYSKRLLIACTDATVPFIYASSASVYGNGKVFSETVANERPINVYGYSKYLFDQYVRSHHRSGGSQVVGLRYFNVYGPGEKHKGTMASVAFHLHEQLQRDDQVRLFSHYDGYAAGEQRRDFIHVDDVVAVNLWFFENGANSGIYNLGTGRSETFNTVANAVIGWHGRGTINYVPFPDHLKGHYQSYTQADLGRLRGAGYSAAFLPVAAGVVRYLDQLTGHNRAV